MTTSMTRTMSLAATFGPEYASPIIKPYKYEPLSSPDDIRLLRIHRNDASDAVLVLSISRPAPLGTLKYAALSYTWGDPNVRKEVRLNGHKFEVTENLHDALIEFERDFHDNIPIWIDAICINQGDLAERAEQVKIMRDIFAHSTCVLAWIGRQEKDDGLAFDFIDKITNVIRKQEEDSQQSKTWPPEMTVDWFMQSLGDPHLECEWNALAGVFRRTWWRRAWIVQEIAVSKVAYLCCGSLTISLLDVLRICSLYHMCMNRYLTSYGGASNNSRLQLERAKNQFPGLLVNMFNGAMLWNKYADQMALAHTGPSDSIQGRQVPVSSISSLYQIFSKHSQTQSTDPRDMVYAFLGLAKGMEEIKYIKIDYQMSVEALYRQVTRAHIGVHKNLKIFDWTGGIEGGDFSSWAHDVASGTLYPAEMFEAKDLDIAWTASLNIAPQPRFEGEEEEDMILQGICFDIVEKFGAKLPGSYVFKEGGTSSTSNNQSRSDVYTAWQDLVHLAPLMKSVLNAMHKPEENSTPRQRAASIEHAWLKASESSGRYPTGQSNFDAFIQTTLLDPLPTETYCNSYVARRTKLLKNWRADPLTDAFDGVLVRECRFYVTKRGYYGIGCKNMSIGDKVCILYGSPTPYVLHNRGDHYVLIGWSYVHGIMDGQAVKYMEEWGLKEEEFRLR